MKQFWDEKYTKQPFLYGEKPNDFFRETIQDLKPGSLLLPGEGEGRNAVYAARHGWRVTALDSSRVAINNALKLAGRYGVTINYLHTDLINDPFPAEQYDLIALCFLHLPEQSRPVFHQKLMEHLNQGGILIGEFFSREQLKYNSGGPKDPSMLYTRENLIEDFSNYRLISLEQKNIMLNEGPGHQGLGNVLRIMVTK